MAKLTSAKARKILHDKSVHGQPLTDKQRRFFGAIAGGAKPYKAESGGWLDKYDAPIAQNGIEGTMGGLTDKGFNYNGAWGGPSMQNGGNLMPAMAGANQTVPMAQLGDSVKPITMQLAMGGSLPGATGGMYARTGSVPRTINPAPDNGPRAKKTKASAQDGKNVEYKELPEIVVVGGKDKPTIDLYRKELDKLKVSENNPYTGAEAYANYYAKMQMAKEFGVPKVRPAAPVGTIGSFFRNRSGIKSDPNKPWPQYSPFTKTVYAGFNDSDEYRKEYIPELSHYVSQTKRKEFLGKDEYTKALLSDLWQYAKGSNPYNVEGTEENFAHFQLEPALKETYYQFKKEGRNKFIEAADSAMKRKLYEKKNKLQDGGSMSYYQQGLDFKPKTISQDGTVIDPMGYWNPENVGNPVIIPSTDITMDGVDQPLIGISDTGDVQYMQPGEDYSFDGEYVTEYPVARKGVSVNMADQYPIEKLDQSLNFTNYNKPTKGGWLDKYK